MSEASLYAIDSVQVTDPENATHFLEQAAQSGGSPSAGIAAFFAHLLQVWPEDGSKGAVWYEGFTHNQPSGAVLEMVFALRAFDEQCLGQLRAIAEQHGVHIFDPEGEVLYLADGSEVVG